MKLSIVIPVYNEFKTLRNLIEKVREVEGIDKEIILVDDCSRDGTRDLYPELAPLVDKIILHDRNQGKGAAIRTGIEHVTGDYVIIQDADLEYDPQEYHILLQPVLQGKADVVYGSRFMGGRPHRVLYFWHSMGNKFLTLVSNMFTNLNLSDMETCYKLVRADLMKAIRIEQNRFGFEPELTGKLAAMDVRIFEVSISYNGRSYAEGKKIGWKDGFQALWCVMKYSRGRCRRNAFGYRDYGKETLQVLQKFDAYAEWMYRKIRPFLGKRIMEIGSGIGNNANHLASEPGTKVLLADYRQDYVDTLKAQYGDNPNISCHLWDATQPAPEELTSNPPDSIVMLNVLEHIEQDRLALKNLYDLLPPGGRLVVLVPAFQALYCRIDKNLDHYRRYDMPMLQGRFREAGFELKESFYFNAVGALGWFVAGKILRAEQIKEGHVGIQKLLMPVTRAVDSLKPPFGLSVACVGEKPVRTHTDSPAAEQHTRSEPLSAGV